MIQGANSATDYDLFISYSHKDDQDEWITELIEIIQREHGKFSPLELKVFFDHSEIQTMDDWEHRILGALRFSKLMLAILSPAYFASNYCHKEWEKFEMHELDKALQGEGIAPIYAQTFADFENDAPNELSDWIKNLKRRQFLDLRSWRLNKLSEVTDDNFIASLQKLEQVISLKLEKEKRISSSPTNIPHHNSKFVGRRNELRRLREMVGLESIGSIVVIQGPPGIGKSALAYEYAHQFAIDYPNGRFVVGVAGITDLRDALKDLGHKMGIQFSQEEEKDPDAICIHVRTELEKGERTLIVLDNADDPVLLQPAILGKLFPFTDKVHVLITSRVGLDHLRDMNCLDLTELPEADSIGLLEMYRPFESEDEKNAAREIVTWMGGYTIQIEMVAVYLWLTPEVSYTGYFTRLKKEGLEALEETAKQDTITLNIHREKSFIQLFASTLGKLSYEEEFAVALAVLFPPDQIPLPWVKQMLEQQGVISIQQPGYSDPWLQIKRRLEALQILNAGDDPNTGYTG